jgi:hypothetical protein
MCDLARMTPIATAANNSPRVAFVDGDVGDTRGYRRTTSSEASNEGLYLAGLSGCFELPEIFLMQGYRRVYSADEADKCFMSPDNMQEVQART